MTKPNRSTRKALSLASLIGAAIKSFHNGSVQLTSLNLQINRAMSVYSRQDRKDYLLVTDMTFKLWEKLATRYSTLLTEDETAYFVSMLCTLIPPKDFHTFLGVMPYESIETLRPGKREELSKSVLDLDQELNLLFGTKPYTMRVIKPKKVKIKQKRSKNDSKRLKHQRDVEIARKRKERKKSFLRGIKQRAEMLKKEK